MAGIGKSLGLKKSIGLSLKEHLAEIDAPQDAAAGARSQFVLSHLPDLLTMQMSDVLDSPEHSELPDEAGSAHLQGLAIAAGAVSSGQGNGEGRLGHGTSTLLSKLTDVLDGLGASDLPDAAGMTVPPGLLVAPGAASSAHANARANLGSGSSDLQPVSTGLARAAEVASAKSQSGALDSQEAQSDLSGSGYGALGFPEGGAGDVGSPEGGAPVSNSPVELLVQFDPGMGAAQFAAVAAALGGKVVETIHTSAMIDAGSGVLVRMTFGQGLTVEQAMKTASKLPGVEFAEPNWGISVQTTINDPYFTDGSLWGMYSELSSPANQYGSKAYDAWAAGYTGSTGLPSKTVVGVIDTGIDYTHPDIYLNIWINQNEITDALFRQTGDRLFLDHDGDGQITFYDLNNSDATFVAKTDDFVTDVNKNGRIDAYDLLNSLLADKIDAASDSNAMVDDLVGWDFVNGDNNPFDDHNHGTHVGGTIGAIGDNGTGVVGVAWDVQMMALKFLSASGSGSTSGAIQAIDYYTAVSKDTSLAGIDQNFVATNNSWGGGGFSQALLDAIVRGAQQDSLFIAAAGNGGRDGKGDNNDSTAYYPANYNTTDAIGWDAVIAVAAINSDGTKASFSNYGATTVELGAPGSYIWSTVPGGSDPAVANDGSYARYSGTSMATPHVAGAVALFAAANPTASAEAIREALLASTVFTASLDGKTLTDGRLDVGTLLDQPVVSKVVYGIHDGTLKAGDTVTLTVVMNKEVAADTTAGTPTLSLNSGATATYAVSSLDSKNLVFTYTVQSGDTAADLGVTAFNLNGATIRDVAGNDAILVDAVANPTGMLQVDTTAPTVSVSAADISLVAGDTTTITFQFSEEVAGFELSDVTASGGEITDLLKLDADTYTATYTAGTVDGSYSVGVIGSTETLITYTDPAENPGSAGSVSLSIGTTSTLSTPTLSLVSADTGGSDNTTFDVMPTLQGTADPNVTIEVWDGTTPLGTTTADGSGSWTFTAPVRLAEGNHSFTAIAVSGDVKSDPSAALAATIEYVYGTVESDTVQSGFSGLDEVISGLPKSSSSLGELTIDTLIGSGGDDFFILGDSRGHYYDDNNRKTLSTGDYAVVNDFLAGDVIQLHGDRSKYLVANGTTVDGVSGAGIYVDKNGNLKLDDRDELIGIVKDTLASNLQYQFVSSDSIG